MCFLSSVFDLSTAPSKSHLKQREKQSPLHRIAQVYRLPKPPRTRTFSWGPKYRRCVAQFLGAKRAASLHGELRRSPFAAETLHPRRSPFAVGGASLGGPKGTQDVSGPDLGRERFSRSEGRDVLRWRYGVHDGGRFPSFAVAMMCIGHRFTGHRFTCSYQAFFLVTRSYYRWRPSPRPSQEAHTRSYDRPPPGPSEPPRT